MKADTKVDARGLSDGKQMFRQSRGKTRVDMVTVIVINKLLITTTIVATKGASLLLHHHSRYSLENLLASTVVLTFR